MGRGAPAALRHSLQISSRTPGCSFCATFLRHWTHLTIVAVHTGLSHSCTRSRGCSPFSPGNWHLSLVEWIRSTVHRLSTITSQKAPGWKIKSISTRPYLSNRHFDCKRLCLRVIVCPLHVLLLCGQGISRIVQMRRFGAAGQALEEIAAVAGREQFGVEHDQEALLVLFTDQSSPPLFPAAHCLRQRIVPERVEFFPFEVFLAGLPVGGLLIKRYFGDDQRADADVHSRTHRVVA